MAFPSLTYARFHLQGAITDEHGQPLDGVHLTVDGGRWKEMGTSTEYETTRYQVDNRFDIRTNAYSSITLYVGKPGYYSESLSFRAPVDGTTQQKTIHIVLQKQGLLTPLTVYETSLSFSSDGTGTVFDFDDPPKAPWGRAPATQRFHDPDTPAGQRPHGMYMTVAVDATGQIALVNRSDPKHQMGQFPNPKGVTLHLTDSNGGFVLVRLQAGRRHNRQMTQAPEAGYAPVLHLSDDDLPLSYSNEWPAAFYFKVDGKYGRGRIGNARLSADGRSVELLLNLVIQLDGSRNLEMLDESKEPST